MVTKIESLTESQEKHLVEYRQECLEFGRSTQPADRPEAERVFREMYALLGKPAPAVLWFDGPATAAMFRALVTTKALGDNLWANLGANLVFGFWGQHELSWPACYLWPHLVLRPMYNEENAAKLRLWFDLGKAVGWWHPFDKVVIACERPSVQVVDDSGRLHREDGPALLCRDSWPLWAINGTTLDEKIVMQPETQTVAEIDADNNEDRRSTRINRFGWPRYLRETGSDCRDHRDNPVTGTPEALYRTKKGEQRLLVGCVTGRPFALGVPSEVENCEQAQNWLGPQIPGLKLNCIGAT